MKIILLTAAACLCSACGEIPLSREAAAEQAAQWELAQQMWQKRDINAYRAWMALDPTGPLGKTARRRLAEADLLYLEGIRLFAARKPRQARQAFVKGARLGPIDPAHYFPLAEIYREREIDQQAVRY